MRATVDAGVHRRAQPHRHLDEDVVARLAPEQVVDRLEAVEIEDADGEGRRIVGTIADQPVDLVEEAPMVAETGQRVGEREVLALPTVHGRWQTTVGIG